MPEFKLNESDSGFRQRSSDVFACLEGLENDHEAFLRSTVAEREDVKKTWRRQEPAQEDLEIPRKSDSGSGQTHKSKDEATFAVPRVPPRRAKSNRGRLPGRGGRRGASRGPPDHVKHPERWTAYSLAEAEEVTDAQNAQVAFKFLSDLRKRREAEAANDEEEGEQGGRIIFRPQRAKHMKKGFADKSAKPYDLATLPRCSSLASHDEEETEETAKEDEGVPTSNDSPTSSRTVVFRKTTLGSSSRRRAIRARVADDEDTG